MAWSTDGIWSGGTNTTTTLHCAGSGGEIFKDSVESGDLTAWTSSFSGGGGAVAASNDRAVSGTWSAKFTGLTAANAYGALRETIGAVTTVYIRGYYYFTANFNNNSLLNLLLDADGVGLAFLGRQVSGQYRWGVYKNTGAMSYYSADFTLDLNTWICLELKVVSNNGAGVLQLWKDGVSVINQTALNTGGGNITDVRFEPYDVGDTDATTVYLDCCVISGSYIGP